MLMRILTSIRMSQRWDNLIVLHNGAKSTHQSPSQSLSQSLYQSIHNDCIKKIRLKVGSLRKYFGCGRSVTATETCLRPPSKEKKWNECMLSGLRTSLSILQSQCIVYRPSLSVRILRTDIAVMTKLIRHLIEYFKEIEHWIIQC